MYDSPHLKGCRSIGGFVEGFLTARRTQMPSNAGSRGDKYNHGAAKAAAAPFVRDVSPASTPELTCDNRSNLEGMHSSRFR